MRVVTQIFLEYLVILFLKHVSIKSYWYFLTDGNISELIHTLICMSSWLLSHFSCVWIFKTLWTVAHQAPLSMGFPGKILDWISMPSSRESSRPRDWTQVFYVSHIALASGFFATQPIGEAPHLHIHAQYLILPGSVSKILFIFKLIMIPVVTKLRLLAQEIN